MLFRKHPQIDYSDRFQRHLIQIKITLPYPVFFFIRQIRAPDIKIFFLVDKHCQVNRFDKIPRAHFIPPLLTGFSMRLAICSPP